MPTLAVSLSERQSTTKGCRQASSSIRASLAACAELGRLDYRGEIVSAEVAEQRPLRQGARDAGRRLAQHQVAGILAEQIVDVLEPVEIDVQQRDPLTARQDLPEARAEELPVGQPGQRIEGGNHAGSLHEWLLNLTTIGNLAPRALVLLSAGSGPCR